MCALSAREGPSPALAAARRVVRDVLRERYPIRADQILVDVLCRLDRHRWAVEGWTAEPDAQLFALAPEGETVKLGAVADSDGRFETVVSTRGPSTTEGWVVIGSSPDGFVETPELRATTREEVLAGADVVRFGPALVRPETAFVVLVDAARELLEHHLSWLESDSQWRDVELVCVLDWVADLEQARWLVGQLHELYGRPMTLVALPVHAGRRMMREAGAAHAEAREIRWSDWPGRFA